VFVLLWESVRECVVLDKLRFTGEDLRFGNTGSNHLGPVIWIGRWNGRRKRQEQSPRSVSFVESPRSESLAVAVVGDSRKTRSYVCVLDCVDWDCDCIGNCVVDCDCVVDCVRVHPVPTGSGKRPKAGGNSKIRRGCGCASWAVVKRAVERTTMMCGSNGGGGFGDFDCGGFDFGFDCGCAGDASVSIS